MEFCGIGSTYVTHSIMKKCSLLLKGDITFNENNKSDDSDVGLNSLARCMLRTFGTYNGDFCLERFLHSNNGFNN
jgi:hypothetical protein